MSWGNCMTSHIVKEWGETVGKAVDGIHHHDLEAILKAIMAIQTDLDPVAVMAKLTGWSFSCIFK